MFESLESASPDPILGLTEAYKNDPNADKINLTVGVYKDAAGTTPIFSSVKKAEARLLEEQTTKGYLAIQGTAEFGAAVQALLFTPGHALIAGGRAVTADTPGGTGALRVAGDLIAGMRANPTIWLSEPTWPNHPGVFKAAGFEVKTYPYYDAETSALDFNAMKAGLEKIPEGDIVLFHGCCHNPTGVDPSQEQWATIVDIAIERKFVPFLDFAYQGLGNGLDEDSVGVRQFADRVPEFLVASSFSKNFGLYNERVGALTLVANSEAEAGAALSHLKQRIRTNYSNPPAHGAAIVTTVLNDPKLRGEWETEVAGMRDRINSMRDLFVKTLKEKGVDRDFSFLTRQSGMFSFSGLTKEQVLRVRDANSIYMVNSGRINVAGMTETNMDALCEAIAAVL